MSGVLVEEEDFRIRRGDDERVLDLPKDASERRHVRRGGLGEQRRLTRACSVGRTHGCVGRG